MPLTDSRHDMSGLLWDRDNDGVGMDSGMSQDEVEWHGGVVMRRHGLPWCQKLVVTRLGEDNRESPDVPAGGAGARED